MKLSCKRVNKMRRRSRRNPQIACRLQRTLARRSRWPIRGCPPRRAGGRGEIGDRDRNHARPGASEAPPQPHDWVAAGLGAEVERRLERGHVNAEPRAERLHELPAVRPVDTKVVVQAHVGGHLAEVAPEPVGGKSLDYVKELVRHRRLLRANAPASWY